MLHQPGKCCIQDRLFAGGALITIPRNLPASLGIGSFHRAGEPPTSIRRARLDRTAAATAIGSVVYAGAIFGFFYAWVCSTMWGLDVDDPRVAIQAMQAMNASIRNAVFFPVFFLTPVALGSTSVLLRVTGRGFAARRFTAAAIVYLVGGLMLAMVVNVPMKEALAAVVVPSSRGEAMAIWTDYSGRWQLYNVLRTLASGVALVLAGIGLRHAGQGSETRGRAGSALSGRDV